MGKNTEHETTNLDILENLQDELKKKTDKKEEEKSKKDDFAMLKEDYLDYSE